MKPKDVKLMKEADKHIHRKLSAFYDLFSLNLYATIRSISGGPGPPPAARGRGGGAGGVGGIRGGGR